MGTRHKHADVIHAWAEGEEIEYWSDSLEKWYPYVGDVIFRDHFQYRIKPKRVKKEGWVNVYNAGYGNLYPTKEEADICGSRIRKACVRIEWEEEE